MSSEKKEETPIMAHLIGSAIDLNLMYPNNVEVVNLDDVQRITDADMDFLPEFDIIKNPHKDDNWFSDIGGFGETGERIPYYEGYLKDGGVVVTWVSEGSKLLSIRNNSLWVLMYIDIDGNTAAMLGHTFTDLMMHANLTLSTGE